ncbi:hypothetical protein AAE478_008810 [Parahypoxylon ruwenzoriense]
MSAPRTKRQFAGAASDPAQRQITSFFSSSSSPSHPHTSSINNLQRTQSAADLAATSPSLPASVQANLLSVGMRVRKSVPEGYKTGSYSAFALWDDNISNTGLSGTSTMGGEGRSRANAISTPRELLPFCGIHKVGGLDTQPDYVPSPLSAPISSGSNAYPYPSLLSLNGVPLDDSMDEDVPGLTSSQESMASVDSNLPTTPFVSGGSTKTPRKRFFTEDEDETTETPDHYRHNLNLNIGTSQTNDFDGEVSPRSLAPVGWGNNTGSRRILAVPRGKKGGRPRSKIAGGFGAGLDQENVMVADGSSDFDEADFLDRTAELGYTNGNKGENRSWEVEMSDV